MDVRLFWKRYEYIFCPIPMRSYYKKIEGRWKAYILIVVARKPIRFNKLKQLCHPISSNSLIRSLKQLEQDGLISRKENAHTTYFTTPVGDKVSSHLTEIKDLLLSLDQDIVICVYFLLVVHS